MKTILRLRPLPQSSLVPPWVHTLGLIGSWCIGIISGFLIAGLVVYLGTH